ncbi:aspartate aminotransferase [Arthrobacter sp. MYb227]|uniref:pyridoxal phosphate-dependent aminotransferase n=1 Tax=Arthrobacter sp. MYb227 TaxID=1848601 RepID=UPI000CFD8A8A|nr:aminotransferase class I/II-fold pyridoxal phosphate-dependent enzyme [Arthrobacter sp. MYb227]PQZ94910.1 aspartate aminotransferase [Arthrobacter sp. MYb227]
MSRKLKVAERAKVPAFEVMSILDRVAALRASGRDVISLCAGEPSDGAPTAVSKRAAEIHTAGTPMTYTPPLGILELREAIAGHYKRWYNIDVPSANIAVTTGSSGAFMLLFLASFNAGDKVALARPGYPAYANILRTLGVEVIELAAGPEIRYQPSVELLEAAWEEHGELDGLMLASPANPTGTMVSGAELGDLGAWCKDHGVRLISDEIYHGIDYPEAGAEARRSVSAWELDKDSVVISSFSKYWGMTGWRLGWALVPDDLIGTVDALAGNLALCPPAPAQYAALAAFTDESYAEAESRVDEFAKARAALLEAMPRLGWGECAPADGAFYLYAELGQMLGSFPDSSAYCAALLEAEGVAIVPGVDFDKVDGGQRVRLSFAAGLAQVQEAIERIVRFQQAR